MLNHHLINQTILYYFLEVNFLHLILYIQNQIFFNVSPQLKLAQHLLFFTIFVNKAFQKKVFFMIL